MSVHLLLIHDSGDRDVSPLSHSLDSYGFWVRARTMQKDIAPSHFVAQEDWSSYDAVLFLLGGALEGDTCAHHVQALSDVPLSKICVVIEATGVQNVIDHVRYLQAGARDVLLRPVHTEALVARLHGEIARSNAHTQSQEHAQSVENVSLAQDSLNIVMGKKQVSLSRTEYRMMDLFIRHPCEILDKSLLFNHLYQEPMLSDRRIVDVYICRLRKKLAFYGYGDSIRTVWGRGYAFHPPLA